MSGGGTDRPAKIAFVSTMAGSPWGGSEELWSMTAMRLIEAGHTVVASTLDWGTPPPKVKELIGKGAKFHFRAIKKPVLRKIADQVLGRETGSKTVDRDSIEWLRREAPDLVVISQGSPWEGMDWMTACLDLGLAYCPVIHANSEVWWPIDDWLEAIGRGVPAAKRVFFVSENNMRLMDVQCGFPVDNAEIVINPWMADTDEIVPWPDDGVTHLACVGRIDPKAKGQDILLQVMAMPKWRERPVRLNIYGGGPCEKTLRKLCDFWKLENVTFAGHVSDVRGIWAENHALVLPSRFEGLPLVIVEAMLCGRPVVVTDIAGNAQYVHNGVTGFVAEAPTVALFDAALERAWNSRALWREMGAKARADLQEKLPPDPIGVFAERLLALLP